MNNKTIIILIIIVAAVTVAIVSWKTPEQDNQNNNAAETTTTPVVVETDEEDNPFNVTEEPTETPTPTDTTETTPTPTEVPTSTPTPTPTEETGADFSENKNSDWLYGVTEQTVGSTVYFINSESPNEVMAGTSLNDLNATVVYEGENAIMSFFVNGNYMYVVTLRDPNSNYSKFKRVVISNGSAVRLWDFYSSKYSLHNFAVRKDNNTSAGFFLALDPVNDASRPAALYISGYTQKWLKYFNTIDKTATFTALAPNTDLTSLLAVFDNAGSQVEGEIEL